MLKHVIKLNNRPDALHFSQAHPNIKQTQTTYKKLPELTIANDIRPKIRILCFLNNCLYFLVRLHSRRHRRSINTFSRRWLWRMRWSGEGKTTTNYNNNNSTRGYGSRHLPINLHYRLRRRHRHALVIIIIIIVVVILVSRVVCRRNRK